MSIACQDASPIRAQKAVRLSHVHVADAHRDVQCIAICRESAITIGKPGPRTADRTIRSNAHADGMAKDDGSRAIRLPRATVRVWAFLDAPLRKQAPGALDLRSSVVLNLQPRVRTALFGD